MSLNIQTNIAIQQNQIILKAGNNNLIKKTNSKSDIYYTNSNYCRFCYTPSFKATNVELISKMEIALKENKRQELIKIFEQMSDKTKQNIKSLIDKFKTYGLTLEDYIQACVKKSALFYSSTETIEKNVKELVEKFKANGLTIGNYINACIKQPTLFTQSPETIAEHINIIRFSYFNQNKDIDNKNSWSQMLKNPIKLSCSSSLLLTEGIIIPKMFEDGKIPKELKGRRLKQKLEDYLKANPNNKYVLNIKNIPNEVCQTEILKEYLKKITEDLKLPKDMFKINVA